MLFQQSPFADRYNFGYWLNTRELISEAVEVGTHRGAFASRFMFTWLGSKLWCVDPYLAGYDPEDPASAGDRNDDAKEARRVLEPYRGRVNFAQITSEQAARDLFLNHSICFAYIDGCHQESHVRRDLDLWWPKIQPGGVLAGHDFLEPGIHWGNHVQPAVMDFAKKHNVVINLVTEPSGAAWSYYMMKPNPKI